MLSFPLSSSRCLQNLHVLFLSSPEDICVDSDKDVLASAEMIRLGIAVATDVAVDLSVEVVADVARVIFAVST